MGTEIERKFLILDDTYKNNIIGVSIIQGYLCHDPNTVVRVRIYGESAYLTIKSKNFGITRKEYEYEIPLDDAQEMIKNLCSHNITEKIRYSICYMHKEWVVDEFKGQNEGLSIAEIELSCEEEHFEKPLWIGEEITNDYKYAGSNLSLKPYRFW